MRLAALKDLCGPAKLGLDVMMVPFREEGEEIQSGYR
jgi:hypothetical protein